MMTMVNGQWVIVKEEEEKLPTVLDVSEDNDQEPDAEGQYSHAALVIGEYYSWTEAPSLPDKPANFTICGAFRTKAWTTDFTGAYLFSLDDDPWSENVWSWFKMVPHDTDTEYTGLINGVYFSVRKDGVWFPLTWTRVCVSLDSSIGRLVLVVDGRVLKDDIHEEATEVRRPNQFRMKVGYSLDYRVATEFSGQYANLNVFSNPLSPERMENMTRAGSEECGTPGDYVSWEEAPWQLFSKAKTMTVEELDGPCRRESTFNVFTAEFT